MCVEVRKKRTKKQQQQKKDLWRLNRRHREPSLLAFFRRLFFRAPILTERVEQPKQEYNIDS